MNKSALRRRLTVVILSAAILTPGCIERSMMIRSDPPGAEIILDGQDVGKTPYTANFLNYGTHQVILSAKGYQRLKLIQPVRQPGYEKFPIDFFVEMIWPWTVRDNHFFDYKLEPLKEVDRTALGARGEDLRKRSTEMGAAE